MSSDAAVASVGPHGPQQESLDEAHQTTNGDIFDEKPSIREVIGDALRVLQSQTSSYSENVLNNGPRESHSWTSKDDAARARCFHSYTRVICAIIQIQQLDPPEKRETRLDLPPDPNYEQVYGSWIEYLHYYAPAGIAIPNCYGKQFLRSILLSNADALLNRMKSLHVDPDLLYRQLCVATAISDADLELVLAAVHKKREQGFAKSQAEKMCGLSFLERNMGGAKDEDMGVISFECITNDRTPDHLIKLVTLRNLFSRQLPKMPREYITRLVFDRNHFSFYLKKNNEIIGGVCFRPYFQQKFAEIVFLALTRSEQVKGYGTRLMNHLKEHVKKAGIDHFMTYADNHATGYFRKQGFRSKIMLPKERWSGFIKDYDGSQSRPTDSTDSTD
eukprot:Selendium_serpulae@DN5314_c0_g1_i2.p1